MDSDEPVASARLRTSGGILGMKLVDCTVTVTDREIRIDVGRRQDVVPLASITGTRRSEGREAPWGPKTTQLALEKATSNQFGPNFIRLLTHRQHHREGLGVLAAIEELLAARASAVSPSPGIVADQPSDQTELLRKLADLRAAGVISDEEFAAKKADVLRRL